MKAFYSLINIFVLSLLTINPVYSQSQCGNNSSKGSTNCGCSNCPGDPFEPYAGNEFRRIKDLEVWGSVGEIPLVWMRYAYSRYGGFLYQYGHSHNWNSSFNYNMSDAGVNEQGQPLLYIHYAEGGATYFAQDTQNPNLWIAVHEVDKRIFQDGNNFYLQMSNGHRYRFEKLSGPGGYFYQLQDIRDSKQNLYRLTYDNRHLLTRVTEPAGRYLQITHDTVFGVWRVITQVSTSDGRSVHYNYDLVEDGLISSLSLVRVDYGDGTKAEYAYSQSEPGSRPNLEHAIDPRYEGTDVNMRFTYDNDNVWGFIKEEKNGITGKVMATLSTEPGKRIVCYANGRVQVYDMPGDMVGKMKSYTDGLGRKTEYDYQNGSGFLKVGKDALGRVTTYNSLTTYGNPLELTHPDGNKEKWTRDDLDQVVKYTDEFGRVTTYTRDARHRVTRIDYPDGTNERFTYNNFGQVLTFTRANGATETNVYNNRGLKTSFTDAEGNVTKYTYDNADRPALVKDARGNITGSKYDERGLLTKLTNADGSSQTYKYDDFGNRIQVTNEIGNTWISLYDEFKRIDSLTDPLGRLTLYHYDLPGGVCGCSHDNGSPTSIILPSGKTTKIEYDVEWKKINETQGAGTADAATTSYEYDQVGNLVTIVDPRGKSWIAEYDLRNRKKSATDPLGHKTLWTYDNVGNIVTVVRPDAGIMTYQYDELNRMVQSTDPKGQIIKMEYDSEGNLVKLTDPNNNQYNYKYDKLNRRLRMIYPDVSFERYKFDQVGNLKTYTNRKGNIRTYTYDSRDREIAAAWNDNTPAITSSYDAASRLLTLSSDVSSLAYAYDVANQLLSETQVIAEIGAETRSIKYTYNEDGLRNTVTYPGAVTVLNYDYTGRNQVKNIFAGGIPNIVTYSYDLNGNRTSKILKNGTATNYFHDDANRTLTVNNQKGGVSFAQFDYGYDPLDRKTFIKRDNSKGDIYHYDATDQIINVKYNVVDPGGIGSSPTKTVIYNWDAAGNRVSVEENGVLTAYITDNNNEYTKVGAGLVTNNANGDIKTFDGWTYTYDAQDRLTRARKGRINVVFAYDGRNRCIIRKVNAARTYFYYDDWNVIEEADNTASIVTGYIHGSRLDEILLKAAQGDSVLYHYDDLGSVTQLTNAAGNVVETYSYDVFGTPIIRNSSGDILTSSAYSNRFLFTGREFIKEANLYDYRMRVYTPELGRFLQPDPLRLDAMDINIYRFVENNPVNKIDPLGLKCCGVKKGPEYNKEGEIKGNKKFKFSAEFENDAAHDPKCCEVHQFISSNKVPLHKGFPADMKADTWYEDRNQTNNRYGHRRKDDPFYTPPQDANRYSDNGFSGWDQPQGWPAGTIFKFYLVVVDICPCCKTDELYKSKTLTVKF